MRRRTFFLGLTGLGGCGDGMQVIRHGDALYVGHTGTTGMGTTVLDVTDPARPRLAAQWPAPARSHTHKVQVADGLLLVNHEKFPYRAAAAGPFSAGLAIYRIAGPLRPEQIAFWPSGGRGVHRVVWTGGRYAHFSVIPDGFRDRIWMVLDLADPARPAAAAQWWWPGQREDEEPSWPAGERYAAHHALIDGGRAYLGYDDAGMVVLDVADVTRPRRVAHLAWDGGSTHTCLPLPGRGLVVATDEQVTDGPHAPRRSIRVIDVAGATPAVLADCPHPAGFDGLPLRFTQLAEGLLGEDFVMAFLHLAQHGAHDVGPDRGGDIDGHGEVQAQPVEVSEGAFHVPQRLRAHRRPPGLPLAT